MEKWAAAAIESGERVPNDQDEGKVASIVPEWLAADGPARNRDTGGDSLDQRFETAAKKSEYFAGLKPGEPLLHEPPRAAALKNDPLAGDRPSLVKRLFRGLGRFFIAVLIGVGVTLAWQSHGNEAKDMARTLVRTWVPSLGWLISGSTTNSSPDRSVYMQDAPPSQALPLTRTPAPSAAAGSSELAQQLEHVATELAAVMRSLEQLATKQEQMAQEISTLKEAEQDIRQKILSPNQTPAVPIPRSRPTPPTTRSSAVSPSSVRPPTPAKQPLQLQEPQQ